MAPRNIEGTNMWELFEDEEVTGKGGTIKGPIIVRVQEYPDEKLLLVQGTELKVEVKGTDFEKIVTKSKV